MVFRRPGLGLESSQCRAAPYYIQDASEDVESVLSHCVIAVSAVSNLKRLPAAERRRTERHQGEERPVPVHGEEDLARRKGNMSALTLNSILRLW